MPTDRQYEVALSFAGEDRAYVEMVADQLRSRGVTVFYDRYNEADLWGKDLYAHLVDVYMKRAEFTLMFISIHYRDKLWTNHERRAAQARAIEQAGEYILPARFDDTEIPGILPTTGFIDLRRRAPVDVALLVCEKLGKSSPLQKASAVPSPRSPALTGKVAFDFRSHDGNFRIGSERMEFETKWSSSDDSSIHCYNYSPSIRGVALADGAASIVEVGDAATLDFTSSSRTPNVGQFVVLQNTNGFYAALQIVEVQYKGWLKFNYWILSDGTSDFAAAGEP
jgi:hypothetical protein